MSSRGRPYRLFASDRFLSREACRDILDRVVRMSVGGGDVSLWIRSAWTGNVRWAGNQIITSGDTTDHRIVIDRRIRGAGGAATTNRADDDALEACVRRAEQQLRYAQFDLDATPLRTGEVYPRTDLWSDATYALDAAARAAQQRQLVEPAMAAGLLSAGYLEVSAVGTGMLNSAGMFAYAPQTRAEYSVTVRNSEGTASGWAGADNRDWQAIDTAGLSAIALDKCRRSANPVAIEPGRYTVILEPQAVADLMLPLVRSLDRQSAEMGMGPWADRPATPEPTGTLAGPGDAPSPGAVPPPRPRSRIGQKVLDERITIGADPADPDAPFVPFWVDGSPYRAVKWIDAGVLKELSYDRYYALRELNRSHPLNNSSAFRMSGGPVSKEEMIANTVRGLLITRLVNIRVVEGTSLLCSGTTADGVWLIERGKITTPVKNFRFRESPLFAFNNLQALGTPVRVLQRMPAIAPAALVRDFSLTSLADAV